MVLAEKTSFSRSVRWQRLGKPIICKGLSIPCDGPPSSTPSHFTKALMERSHPWPNSDGGTRTNLLFTMSYRTGGSLQREPQTFFLHSNLHQPSPTNILFHRPLGRRRSFGAPAEDSGKAALIRERKRYWWSRTGSNRRHPACKAGALPAELRPLIEYGGPGRT
jgi:hypothetical protein